jgi:hypothetical protein
MNAVRHNLARVLLPVAAAVGWSSFAWAADPGVDASTYQLRVAKAIDGPNAGKPAELMFNREGQTSYTLANAALLLRDAPLPGIGGVMANSWGLSAALAKNTMSGKRSDTLSAGAGLYSMLALSADKQSNLDMSLDALLENDRENSANSHAYVFGATLRSSLFHHDPNLSPGQSGVDAWLYPSAGFYTRKVSSTHDTAAAPVGSHGGASAGVHVTARWVSISAGEKLSIFDRVSFDLVANLTRDSSVSGGYGRATYRYAEASVDYLLYGDAGGTGWKPKLGLSRTRGTNRPGNEAHQDKSSIAFKLSYGI